MSRWLVWRPARRMALIGLAALVAGGCGSQPSVPNQAAAPTEPVAAVTSAPTEPAAAPSATPATLVPSATATLVPTARVVAATVFPTATSLPTSTPIPAQADPSQTTPQLVRPPVRPVATPASEGAIAPTPEGGAVGQVPADLMDQIKADLSARSGVPVDAIVELIGEAVEWPDGSLGCPQPGVSYLQVITPGYRVVLKAGDGTYDYRASDRGFFSICAQTS